MCLLEEEVFYIINNFAFTKVTEILSNKNMPLKKLRHFIRFDFRSQIFLSRPDLQLEEDDENLHTRAS